MTFKSYSAGEDFAALHELQQRYPLTVQLDTPQGRMWKRRMDDSEYYFKRYSRKWEANRRLLCDFEHMIAEFGTYVAIAPAILANFVSDIYFRNPDPFVQDKNGDKDLSRILTDVFRSIHAENNTEDENRQVLQDHWWAGFGGVIGSFIQKPDDAGDPVMEESGEQDEQGQPIMRPAMAHTGELDATGQPVMMPTGETVEPKEQKIVIHRISPWKCRFDPKGRRWDMSDHRWWAYDDVAYLGSLMRDPSLSPDDKARLMAYYGQGGAAFSVDGGEDPESTTGRIETDPEFIRVAMRHIWSRPDHMIYRQPFGASFTFTPRPWDEEWERKDEYPYHYWPAPNRIPEDKKNTEGFIGLPYLELIGQHVKNINKAQGLLQSGLEHVVDIYVTLQGILDGVKMEKMTGPGRMFNVIQVDPKALAKYPSNQDDKIRMDELFSLLKTGDTKDLQHMATIAHEFNLIAQILGQGPADRGGVAPSETATDSLGIQQGIARRMSANRNDAGKHYNAETRMMFIITQARRTLPIRYQMTGPFNEKAWATFTDPRGTLKDADLHFEYATGSTEPQTREQAFALRERAATILMPIFQAMQDTRQMMDVAKMLIEPLNILGADAFFDDQLSQLVMQLLAIFRALAMPPGHENAVTADNAQVMKQIPELCMQIAQLVLTPTQLAQVEATVQGVEMPDGAAGGSGSLPKAPTPGEASAEAGARGSAAAGAQGGIAFSESLPAQTGMPQ